MPYEGMEPEELLRHLQIRDQQLSDWHLFRDGFRDMHREWHEERARLHERVADLEQQLFDLGVRYTNYADKLSRYRSMTERMERRIRDMQDAERALHGALASSEATCERLVAQRDELLDFLNERGAFADEETHTGDPEED